MLKVAACLANNHDPWLVALAAAVCSLVAAACIELSRHARKTSGRARSAWLAVAAVAGGSGIWATHFIAMLAFQPGFPSGYDVALTGLSLLFAIVLTGIGLALALTRLPGAVTLGGAVLGGGIAAMHYTGMSAFEIAGRVHWDRILVAASLLIGAAFAALSLQVSLSGASLRRRLLGAALLLLAICGHHFTAMGAVTIVPDPTVAVPADALPSRWLAIAVAVASLTILFMAGMALVLDIRDRRQAAQQRDRLHSLANASVEGLIVCRNDTIVNANESFALLVGVATAELLNAPLSRFLPDASACLARMAQSDQAIEAELKGTRGDAIPVEVLMRPVTYGNHPHFALAIRDLRARREAEGHIRFLAHHDPLTGLANRASFNQRLEQELTLAAAAERKLAVLCLDLDRFKEINDLFGHAAGDAVLVRVAQIVTGLLDQSQLMGRLGGDEFAVLMPCDHAVAPSRMAEQILEAVRSGTTSAINPAIATSIGIALYPDDATDRAALLGYADTALYKAKADGRGTYRFFEAEMGSHTRERRLLEHDLHHALARGEMHLVYEPQANVQTGEVLGFEVLLRWQHPDRGMVPPSVFVPIAEESGIILQLGEWVLLTACQEAARWPNPLSVAVNVSAVQIHASHFAQVVHEVLFQTGLKPDRLEIEITETALIRDPSRAQSTLRLLKSLGIRIAMDDFGTGYSSLSNLRAYPFDKIKIDASFIRAVDESEQTQAIVRSVLGLGRGLGLPVLAEGVETSAELRFLAAENCDAAQGYLLGRPSLIEQLAHFTHGVPSCPEAASSAA